MQNIVEVVKFVKKKAVQLGWRGSDGGISASMDEDGVCLFVKYNPTKVCKKNIKKLAQEFKNFTEAEKVEVFSEKDVDSPFICLVLGHSDI